MLRVPEAVNRLKVSGSSWSCPEQKKAGARKERSISWVGVDWDMSSISPRGGYLEADGSGGQTSTDEAEATAEAEAEAEAVADVSLSLHIGRQPELA